MLSLNAELGYLPVPVGPPAQRLEQSGDPFSWHAMDPTTPGMMRRRRLIDVTPGEPLLVFAMFRDTYTDDSGTEVVLHEYTMHVTVDPETSIVLSSQATPQALPWPECPAAAASASRIVGRPVDELQQFVRTELRGIATCTHLNDLLRSLRGVGDLSALLGQAELTVGP
jgi:hypothetical protein